MKQRYIRIDNELVPVTEEVYQAANRWKENIRHRARRDGKCSQKDYRRCSGDCATCPWQQEGHWLFSLNKILGDDFENEPMSLSEASTTMEDIVEDRIILEQLYRQLDALIPDGAEVFRMRANNYTEREIASALGVKTQSTLNYRIKKMDEFIRAHRDELNDLFR